LAPIISSIMPYNLQRNWCPPSTFFHEGLQGELKFIAFIPGFLAAAALCALLVGRIDLSAWSGAYSRPKPRGKCFLYLVCFYSVVMGASACLCIDGASFYFCLTPTGIITRQGFFDPGRRMGWEDVKAVYAWCWTAKPRNGASYTGGSVKLSFSDGPELPVALSTRWQPVTYNYEMLRKALRRRTYRYYVNSSVSAGACPPALYPLLWFWPSDEN
jgi:hypothetical protein